MELRIGNGYDIHKLVRNKRLIIGGIEIPYKKGFKAHSDGDVLIHALIDSILGALNLGDIGTHFPDNDPAYKNIDSLILLERINELMIQKGFIINNIDCTIILQKPKLGKYIPLMKKKLAGILKIGSDLISIKAKTKEKLDAAGKGRACEVFIVSLLIKKSIEK